MFFFIFVCAFVCDVCSVTTVLLCLLSCVCYDAFVMLCLICVCVCCVVWRLLLYWFACVVVVGYRSLCARVWSVLLCAACLDVLLVVVDGGLL